MSAPGIRELSLVEVAADKAPAVVMTEQALALAARTPDRAGREALVEIVRRHQRTVCAVAWSVTGRASMVFFRTGQERLFTYPDTVTCNVFSMDSRCPLLCPA